MFLAKDFIETAEGLHFAVVENGLEHGKVLSFLRYVDGKKLSTEAANCYLTQKHPEYLHYSSYLDASLHAVAIDRICKHYQPRQRLQEITRSSKLDAIERDALELVALFQQQACDLEKMGITGSILVGFHNQNSDIDLVCYDRKLFLQCRIIIRQLIECGQLQQLDASSWQHCWDRRACDLSFAEYKWHELRKFNKALIRQRKFDISFIDDSRFLKTSGSYHKTGKTMLQCRVTDDSYGFDYPSEFTIDHPEIKTLVCFTASYTGQAFVGETIEVSGMVEQNDTGIKRIVVGSTREAYGEYIKVIRSKAG
jgi:predicted nucleotidyltransferase